MFPLHFFYYFHHSLATTRFVLCTTADTRRLADRIGKLEGEAKERTRVVQELVRELELLEGERDGALLQAGSAALATERAEERIFAAERRAQELERQLLDARARTQRYEEAAAAQVAQRTALMNLGVNITTNKPVMISKVYKALLAFSVFSINTPAGTFFEKKNKAAALMNRAPTHT